MSWFSESLCYWVTHTHTHTPILKRKTTAQILELQNKFSFSLCMLVLTHMSPNNKLSWFNHNPRSIMQKYFRGKVTFLV